MPMRGARAPGREPLGVLPPSWPPLARALSGSFATECVTLRQPLPASVFMAVKGEDSPVPPNDVSVNNDRVYDGGL